METICQLPVDVKCLILRSYYSQRREREKKDIFDSIKKRFISRILRPNESGINPTSNMVDRGEMIAGWSVMIMNCSSRNPFIMLYGDADGYHYHIYIHRG